MEKMDNVVGLLLLGVILFVLRGGVSGTVCSNQHYYSTASDAVKVTPMSTTSASSLAFCASICSRQSSCRYFRWTYQTSQCSLFRDRTRYEVGSVESGLTEKQRCEGSRKPSAKGVCHCDNGYYGPRCDQPFTYDLQLIGECSSYHAEGVDQMELFNRSTILIVSAFTQTNSNHGRFFASSYGSQTYNASGSDFNIHALTSGKFFTAFGTAYLVLTAYHRSTSDATNPTGQYLMRVDTYGTHFYAVQNWTDLAVTHSTVFTRSTGDIYLCYPISNQVVNNSIPGMKIFKFNATAETFDLQYTVNDTGMHMQCAFVDIDGTLYALSDSPSKNTTTLHRLSSDDATWQPYQNISNSRLLRSLSVAFSTQANTHMLAFGHGTQQQISIYLWYNERFLLNTTVSVDFDVELPYLMEAGHDMFLFASYDQPTNTSQLSFYKFNGTDFNLYRSQSNSKPSGGFHHFWFEDNLYLVVLNKFNVFDNSSENAYNTANQQVFQVI